MLNTLRIDFANSIMLIPSPRSKTRPLLPSRIPIKKYRCAFNASDYAENLKHADVLNSQLQLNAPSEIVHYVTTLRIQKYYPPALLPFDPRAKRFNFPPESLFKLFEKQFPDLFLHPTEQNVSVTHSSHHGNWSTLPVRKGKNRNKIPSRHFLSYTARPKTGTLSHSRKISYKPPPLEQTPENTIRETKERLKLRVSGVRLRC
jgi:hypothetical protein